MANLTPTPELVATARRVDTNTWTVAPDADAFGPDMDPSLRLLVSARLAVLYFPPTRLRDDYWTLTTYGRQWLADAEGK
jgi:hypothetical protein